MSLLDLWYPRRFRLLPATIIHCTDPERLKLWQRRRSRLKYNRKFPNRSSDQDRAGYWSKRYHSMSPEQKMAYNEACRVRRSRTARSTMSIS